MNDKLVTSLEVAKKLPRGEFKDSMFVWLKVYTSNKGDVRYGYKLRSATTPYDIVIAPALMMQELMEKFDLEVHGLEIYTDMPDKVTVGQHLTYVTNSNPCDALAELWLMVREVT